LQGQAILDFGLRILDWKTFDRALSIQNPQSKVQNELACFHRDIASRMVTMRSIPTARPIGSDQSGSSLPAADEPLPNAPPQDVDALDERLSRPTPGVVGALGRLDGDILVLGAAGKMGPTLTRMAKRAGDEAGVRRRVIAVSRFSDPAEREKLDRWGIETIPGDLLDESFLADLPDAANVVFMAGMKFGSSGKQALTWQMNTVLPALVARRFTASRIAAFSTGNIYGMTPLSAGGSLETDEPRPQGEYAMSCLGRERAFEHAAASRGTRVAILRLNYAAELRYGVLVDLAQKIVAGKEIDLSMSMANVLWQGDANAWALQSLEQAASPAAVFNLAGPEQLGIQRVCRQLGARMGLEPRFTGTPGGEALLTNGQWVHRLFGYPRLPIDVLIEWVAGWVKQGGQTLGKPTKFEVRDGRF
jgi:nucleoside-diphosphate-sugar epimerase